MKLLLSFLLVLLVVSVMVLWSPVHGEERGGWDVETFEHVVIENGAAVDRDGHIPVYDTRTRSYHDMEIDEVRRSGSDLEIDVWDWTEMRYRTLEVDR